MTPVVIWSIGSARIGPNSKILAVSAFEFASVSFAKFCQLSLQAIKFPRVIKCQNALQSSERHIRYSQPRIDRGE